MHQKASKSRDIVGFRAVLTYSYRLDAEATFELLEKLPMLRPTHCSDNERKRIKYSRVLAVEISQRNNRSSGHFVCFWHRLGKAGCNVLGFHPNSPSPRTFQLEFLGNKEDLAQAIEDVAVFCEATTPDFASYRLWFASQDSAPNRRSSPFTGEYVGSGFPTGMSYPAAELYQEFGLGPLPYGTFIGAAMKPLLQPLLDSVGYGYAGDHRWLLARPTAELILDEELYLKGLERSYGILLKQGLAARWHVPRIHTYVSPRRLTYYYAPNWKPIAHWSALPPPDHRPSRNHVYMAVLPNLPENQDPPRISFENDSIRGNDYSKSVDLAGISFHQATIEDINFTGADLRGCDFRGATFKNVTWTGANLEGALFDPGAEPEV